MGAGEGRPGTRVLPADEPAAAGTSSWEGRGGNRGLRKGGGGPEASPACVGGSGCVSFAPHPRLSGLGGGAAPFPERRDAFRLCHLNLRWPRKRRGAPARLSPPEVPRGSLAEGPGLQGVHILLPRPPFLSELEPSFGAPVPARLRDGSKRFFVPVSNRCLILSAGSAL